MRSLESIKAELEAVANQAASTIESLKVELEAAQREAKRESIAQIKQIMADNGITAADLGFKAATKATTKGHPLVGRKVTPLFTDPKTGKTWAGRGSKPQWVKDQEALTAARVAASGQAVRKDDGQGKLV